MIVKNEEETLGRCLESVQDIVDEIIIVDTGSQDRTKEIALRYKARIFDFQWIDDFSAARNYSFDQATMDYILWLDADDVILPEDKARLLELKKNLDPSVDTIMLKYAVGFDLQGNITFSFFRERISKRLGAYRWVEPVHEYLQIGKNVIEVDIKITHMKNKTQREDIEDLPEGRNLAIYEGMLLRGEKLTPRGTYYYARELKDHERHEEAIKQFNLFLDSKEGWIEDNIFACVELANCYRILKQEDNMLRALLKSFEYDLPRAEICCQIGYYYKAKEYYKKACFWFELAEKLEKPENSWGFLMSDCWGYIPCLELTVCYDKLGDIEKAIYYNNKAGEYKPGDPSVLYNIKYFEQKEAGATWNSY
jgi:glycosyltransferase involved in cell wall biosynthesis